jgi:hypothetical protein
MSRFTSLADKAIKDFNTGDIDKYLEKIANENELNKNEHQRLIEEYNIGVFLKKLAEGSQHEEYSVASPVSIPSSSGKETTGEIEKVASTTYGEVSESMFHIDFDSDFTPDDTLLEKVASSNMDDHIFSAEDKWRDADTKREEVLESDMNGIMKIASDEKLGKKINTLMKVASISEGQMKTVVSVLAKKDLGDVGVQILEDSKYSSFDVIDAKAEELSKEAIEHIAEIENILKG